ncbi:MAG: T9SS type A sorting domain-containing protein [Ferruginibacter sp.]
MQAGPNPFVDRINIGFEAAANGNAEIRITNIAGKTMITKKYNVSNGYNNLQVNGLGTLSSGMYMVQVFVNGVAMDTQKMIKN